MCATSEIPPRPSALHRQAVLAGHSGDAGGARALVDNSEPRVRAAALSALVRMGLVTVGELSLALDDTDPFVRRRAAEDVGHLTDLTLAPTLGGVLADEDPTVVEMACWAAGEVERSDDQTIAALMAIATEHADALCREAAVAALGAIGDQRGQSAVLAACTDKATVRRRAVLALAAFDGEECIDALRALTADRDLQVRQSAEDLLAIVEGQSIGCTTES